MDIDLSDLELEAAITKPKNDKGVVSFKKKIKKSQKSSQRAHDLNDDDESAPQIEKRQFKRKRNFFKSDTKRDITPRPNATSEDLEAILNDDPENLPAIENLKALNQDEQKLIPESIEILPERKKYVPIETNREPDIKAQDYLNEYASEDNYDDGTKGVPPNKDDGADMVDDVDMVSDDDMTPKETKLDESIYDLEILGNDDDSDFNENYDTSSTVKLRNVATADQLLAILEKSVIEKRERIAISQQQHQTLQEERQRLQDEKTKLLNSLNLTLGKAF